MQISTKIFNEQAVSRFQELTGEIQKNQAKIATGKKVMTASDDPTAATNISVAKDQKLILERYDRNIDHALNRLALGESIVADSTQALTRIYELSIQASNGVYNSQDMYAIGAEVAQLKQVLVGFANTKDQNGDHLFSGFKLKTTPFAMDPTGVVTFEGGRGLHSVQISESAKMNTALDGAELFMGSTGDDSNLGVFAAISDLQTGLDAGAVSASTLGALKAGIDHLSIKQAVIGAEINKGEIQKGSNDKRMVILSEDLSRLEDADLTKLVTELQSMIVSRDAAQQAFVKISQQTLFDFLR